METYVKMLTEKTELLKTYYKKYGAPRNKNEEALLSAVYMQIVELSEFLRVSYDTGAYKPIRSAEVVKLDTKRKKN